MRPLKKRIILGLASLISLLFLAVSLFFWLFEAPKFQRDFFQVIEKSTGYQAHASTPITWSLTPWIGIDLHTLILTPPKPSRPKVTIDHTHVLISPWALLQGDILPHTLELRGVHIISTQRIQLKHLGSWLHKHLRTWPKSLPTLNIKITEGSLMHQQHSYQNWSLQAHNLSGSQPFTLTSVIKQPDYTLNVSALIHGDTDTLYLENTRLGLTDTRGTNERISGDLHFHPKTYHITLKDFVYDSASLRLQGELQCQAPHYICEGTLSLPASNLANFLNTHQINPGFSHQALQNIALKLTLTPQAIQCTGTLDQQKMQARYLRQTKHLTLAFDTLHLHRYGPLSAYHPNSVNKKLRTFLTTHHIPMPERISLTANNAYFREAHMKQFSLSLHRTPSLWLVNPITAQWQGASWHGEASLSRQAPYHARLQLASEQLNITPLFHSLSWPIRLEAKQSHGVFSFKTDHIFSQQWQDKLTGQASLIMTQGLAHGLNWQRWTKKPVSPPNAHSAPLPFQSLTTTLSLQDHQISTDQLRLVSKPLQVSGSGLIDLVEKQLNVSLNLRLNQSIPAKKTVIKIFGPLKKPTVLAQHHQPKSSIDT